MLVVQQMLISYKKELMDSLKFTLVMMYLVEDLLQVILLKSNILLQMVQNLTMQLRSNLLEIFPVTLMPPLHWYQKLVVDRLLKLQTQLSLMHHFRSSHRIEL